MKEGPRKNEDEENGDTRSEIKDADQDKGQDETEIVEKDTMDPSTAENIAESGDNHITRDPRNRSPKADSVDSEDNAQTRDRVQGAENSGAGNITM